MGEIEGYGPRIGHGCRGGFRVHADGLGCDNWLIISNDFFSRNLSWRKPASKPDVVVVALFGRLALPGQTLPEYLNNMLAWMVPLLKLFTKPQIFFRHVAKTLHFVCSNFDLATCKGMARHLQLLVVEIRQRNAQLVPYLDPLNLAPSPRGRSILHHGEIHIRLLGRGNE